MLRFGLCFPKASYVLTNEHLQQIDATHWTLDLRTLVGPEFHKVRDVCLFLANAEGTVTSATARGADGVTKP